MKGTSRSEDKTICPFFNQKYFDLTEKCQMNRRKMFGQKLVVLSGVEINFTLSRWPDYYLLYEHLLHK